MTNTNNPRIYVACLAAYNDGRLHGNWIDLDGLDAEDIGKEIDKILRTSPSPNIVKQDHECSYGHEWSRQVGIGALVCPECDDTKIESSAKYSSSEEWAIHDHEGLGDISEYESIDHIVELMELMDKHGCDLVDAVKECFGSHYFNDASEINDKIDESFRGSWDSFRDFSDNHAHECIFDMTPSRDAGVEQLKEYFDYESYSCSLENSHVSARINHTEYVFDSEC